MSNICYFQESFVPHEQAVVHAEAGVMRYGSCVFEGIRGYLQESSKRINLFALRRHLDRLSESVSMMSLDIDMDIDFEEIIHQLIVLNNCQKDVYVRVACFDSSQGNLTDKVERGELLITVKEMGRKSWLQEHRLLRTEVSSIMLEGENYFSRKIKSISNYDGARLAQIKAKKSGFDLPILKSSSGYICEAPVANIFYVKEGVLVTPSLDLPVLAGVTRSVVLDVAKGLGVPVIEKRFLAAGLYCADEVFLTGTAFEISPVRSVDHYEVTNKVGEVTKAISDEYYKLARKA